MAIKLWSNKGVALYPVDFPLVGQNAVFNGLFKFKQSFLSNRDDDIAGFFALIGDWGLGKTRIGYELIAQTADRVEKWVLNTTEFVVPNALNGRLLEPQLAEGILPLFIRYEMVCNDDLYAENWIAKVATEALRLVAQPGGHQVPAALIEDLRAALKARGVDLEALGQVLLAGSDDDARLAAAMNVLRKSEINYLWVVVDEVETLADRKRGLPDSDQSSVSENFLDMVSMVIKHENYRQAHPEVNFLMLCSAGMRDKIEIGPNRRRTDLVELEPNRISDVRTYVESLRERAESAGQSVDYPAGTLEGAFIACNRNFGWFNVMMSSIHESYRQYREQGRTVEAWQLIEEFAKSETRAQWIFDRSVLDLLRIETHPQKDVLKRLVFGQLPVTLSDIQLSEAQLAELRRTAVPGMGTAFVDLVEVHLDAPTLATELVKPEIGFKLSIRGGDWYTYYNSDISLSNLLAALQAFSVGVTTGNFVVCCDLNAFAAQLSALYERPNVDILQIAEPLHGVFMKYEVAGQSYLASSFVLLQRLDILLKRASATVAFLQDSKKDADLEKYAGEVSKTERKLHTTVCQGFARLLNDSLVSDATEVKQIQSSVGVWFTSEFQSPRFDGLRVTPDGRVTIAYAHDIDKLAQDLADLIGQEGVHPVIVLLPPGSTIEEWRAARLMPLVQLCVIPRGLTRAEEAFLVKYSARGKVFQPSDALSAKTHSIHGAMRQQWQQETANWRDDIERQGYLVRPLWYSKTISEQAFARGYRAMLVNGWNIDKLAPDVNQEFDAATFDLVKKACQYNVEPGPGQEPLLEIVTREEPYAPVLPPLIGTLLRTLKSQTTIDALKRRSFFAVPEKRIKINKQLEQILSLLCELGLVTFAGNAAYRAVDAQVLKGYREATSAWLSGQCRSMLTELGATFTQDTVGRLQKLSGSLATSTLTAVEHTTTKADFSFLDADGAAPTAEGIRALVQRIAEVEQKLKTICPAGVYQRTEASFECTTDRIAYFEQRLSTLSVWEQVQFLHWLSKQYRQRREELAHAVRQQLGEAESGLSTIEGYPFPIAPLSQPLKAILDELTAPMVAAGPTSRGAIPVLGYAQPVNVYIYLSQYDNAWKRLETLGQLVEKGRTESFWARFQATRSAWSDRLKDYQAANMAWETLTNFMGNATSPAWSNSKVVKANLDALRGLVDGGLQQAVVAELDGGSEKLIEALQAEVEAAAKYHTLPDQIHELQQNVENELKDIIDQTPLQALSRVLAAKRRSQLQTPKLAETYTDTKNAYEAFNVKVDEIGRGFFETAGKQTTWSRWVEIYVALRDGRYTPSPDDEKTLQEFEEMKLIERTIRLKQ